MDDRHRESLQTELKEARRQRDDLDAVIRYLTAKLGLSSVSVDRTEAEVETVTPAISAASSVSDASVLVAESEFYGMSSTRAARTVLERVGRTRPLKTGELLSAIKKGGVNLSEKNAPQILYKSLDRAEDTFVKVGKGRWGLTEWYTGRSAQGRPKPQTPSVDGEPETHVVDLLEALRDATKPEKDEIRKHGKSG